MTVFDLTDEQIERIERDFSEIPAQNRAAALFDIFNTCSEEERICLKYLYAYMPVSDLASYSGAFHLKVVRDTLAAMKAVSWGDRIKGELFFNYVLPLRLNNEDLVDHRALFFKELFPRIKSLSLEQAVLEVNYWCFEHATYQSTDIRTSSPLTVIRNAFGRCGEESVLCVAALRSVGIPARQCYTPRWAHCDDNHAWVEVWVDGVWHFIGACEPEAVLDKGWFAEPAKRAMLVHARVFSRLVSEPEITNQTSVMSQVNVLSNYTKTKTLLVTVTDAVGLPVEDAEVRFELINFAQLYPIAVIKTDRNGQAHLLTGIGDLYVSVSKNGYFLHTKANHTCETLSFYMADAMAWDSSDFELDVIPPPKCAVEEQEASKEESKRHETRIDTANALRHAVEDSFIRGERAEEFASKFKAYREEIADLISLSNGNHKEIAAFLKAEGGIPLAYRIALLKSLNKKDLSDSSCSMLNSHLEVAYPYRENFNSELFNRYLLCPRVYFEMLTDYRGFILAYFSEVQKGLFKKSPKEVYRYIEKNIADCGDRDYSTIFASPQGLLELKCGSEMSKKILFTAICRTLGIPARMSEIDQKVEYMQDERWYTLVQSSDKPVERNCKLTLIAEGPTAFIYEKNFTLARLEEGVYQTLGLDSISLENGSVSYLLQEGNYRLTTANRLNDGSILALITHISLETGCEKNLPLVLRQPAVSIEENVLLPQIFVRTSEHKTAEITELIDCEGSYAVAFLKEGIEPTVHLLNEILEQKEVFSKNKRSLLLIMQDETSLQNPLLKDAIDQTGIAAAFRHEQDAFEDILKALKTENRKLPLVLGLKEGNLCRFHTSGYNVGTGDLLLRHFEENSKKE